MTSKSSLAHKNHDTLSSNKKKGSNGSVSSDASVVTLKASNKSKVNARRAMNAAQLQAFRMMRDPITDIQRSVLEPLLQAFLNVNQNEEGRRTVIRYIEDLLNNLDRNIVTNFVEVLHGLSTRALAEGRNFTRDGFLGEILLINEDENDDDDAEEELHITNIEERAESDTSMSTESSVHFVCFEGRNSSPSH